MGHLQPATKIKADNSTANEIINGTITQNRSKAINMRFYWLKCRQAQEQFKIYQAPGQINLADYFTKFHSPAHHKAVQPIYLYNKNNQLDMQGCIKILNERATSSQRKATCPNGKSVADLNRLNQNVVIQNSIKRIQSLLNRIPALK